MASHIATDYFAHATRFHNRIKTKPVKYYKDREGGIFYYRMLYAGSFYDHTHNFEPKSEYHSDYATVDQYRYRIAKQILVNSVARYRRERTKTNIYYDFYDGANTYYNDGRNDPDETDTCFRLFYATTNAVMAGAPSKLINCCSLVDYTPGVTYK